VACDLEGEIALLEEAMMSSSRDDVNEAPQILGRIQCVRIRVAGKRRAILAALVGRAPSVDRRGKPVGKALQQSERWSVGLSKRLGLAQDY
jgi:hypothetical protein